MLKPAKNVQIGDLITHQGYPAEVLAVSQEAPGVVLIIWGDDPRECCYVSDDAMVEVTTAA